MKYNYVIFGASQDFYKISYNDINNLSNAYYSYRNIDSDSRILSDLYRLHTTPRINRIINLPMQKLWNCMIFRHTFLEDKPLCFIFFSGKDKMIKNGFVEYLKDKYLNSKFVYFYQDLVSLPRELSVSQIESKFDMLLSFDQKDAEKYGLFYYPLVYSPFDVPEDENIKQSDIYFVGKAKNRLKDIISVYEKLRSAGLKCDFHIVGVAPKDRKYANEIDYCIQMPYIENLKRIKKTKCLLEIMQIGGHGYTLRTCEAIMYDKKIITNNPEIEKAPFYSSECIQTFKSVQQIDPNFIFREPISVDYNYKEELSPVHLLEFIDREIQKI